MYVFLAPLEVRALHHLLLFVLTVAAPVGGWLITRRIGASRSSISRLTGYQLAIAALLLTTAATFALAPPQTFFEIQLRTRGVTWLPSRELISVMAVTLVVLTALPVLLARKGSPFRGEVEEQIHKLQRLLPRSRHERLWFGIAAMCAGVCEEFLYRGFVLHYLHVFPWKLNLGASLIISCVIFGIVHLYQGFSGILQTVLLALGLSVLFLSTRSLLLPIVLHVLIDLRVFLILPEPSSTPAE